MNSRSSISIVAHAGIILYALTACSGWRLGSTGSPGALCIRYGEVGTCQGYSVQGDTLFLANGSRTVLVRSAAVDDSLEYVPARHITVPAPGDSGYRRM